MGGSPTGLGGSIAKSAQIPGYGWFSHPKSWAMPIELSFTSTVVSASVPLSQATTHPLGRLPLRAGVGFACRWHTTCDCRYAHVATWLIGGRHVCAWHRLTWPFGSQAVAPEGGLTTSIRPCRWPGLGQLPL
ncbi:hypothetical protein GW17_00024292 [Ensete ventricosum]|nr:hypothetical protein GW17_00024292 [Ensete ventricosum]